MFLEHKKAFKAITKRYKENDNEIINENYYLLQTSFEHLERTKPLKRYYHLIDRVGYFVENNNFDFTKEKYVDYMLSLGKTIELDKYILDVMPSLIVAYLLISITKTDENIPLAVDMLRKITKTDFSSLEPRLFVSERFLENEEKYEYMTPETKSSYRAAFSKFAKDHHLTHKEAEKKLLSSNKTIGELLFPEKNSRTFFVLSTILFLPCMTLLLKIIGGFSLILALPLWIAVGEISDLFISKYSKKQPTLRLAADKCLSIGKTLVVTTSLVGDNDKLFENVELFYLANKTAPAYFGLLLDHPDSQTQEDEKSKEHTEKAKKKITELNEKYGERFFLFLRHRVKNDDGKYYGWERKRGAVTELVRFIHGEKTTISHFVGSIDDLKKVKYMLTLDSDTLLSLESVNEIVGTMAHPRYRPIIKNGKVVKGYGIMQPKMVPTIESSTKTPFSSMLSIGGTDIYESASYDRYMHTYGEGAFCGKGMIDVELFYKLVDLPEGFVLSHDLPEGSILRTRSLNDVTLSDSTPKNMLSHSTRAARWCRGDIQNLWLWNKVSGVGRLMMLSNVARLLCPILVTLTIILSLVHPSPLSVTLSSLSILILPQLVSILFTPSYFVLLFRRRTFSKITKSSIKQLCLIAHKVLSLSYVAYVNMISILRSLVRMTITKKKRLEWITASEIDKSGKGGFWYFVQRMLFSCGVGAALFLMANDLSTKLLGISWFLYPLVSYLSSLPAKPRLPQRDNSELKEEIARMYRFFADNVTEKTFYLPPDNVSFYPMTRVAMRTSPTNIGLYLLSTVSAASLSLISEDELITRIENTLTTLEHLEKWNGHLYNWYDLTDLHRLNGYVSTVDSGNLITSLVAVGEALRQLGQIDLAERCDALTKADMQSLYNTERDLFFLGYDVNSEKHGDICYDLYMSEARTTSYFACATGSVPKKHWRMLSRVPIEKNGYIGMASWTGTAFEYFMPTLLLPHPENTFLEESLIFAYHRQRSYTRGGVYGISESGYHHFDHEMNYQYKAFGVPALSLKHYTEDEYVFSPYSTYLMAYLNERAAKTNLSRLQRLGAYGKYGFYEAVDMRNGGAKVVRSYMSHHVGMSICALTDLINDGYLQKLFMNNKSMKCAHELLEERIPDVGAYKRPHLDHPQRLTSYSIGTSFDEASPYDPTVHAISDGVMTIVATSNGNVSLRRGELIVNECNFTLPLTDKTIDFGLGEKIFIEKSENALSLISDEEYKSVTLELLGNCFFLKMLSKHSKNTLQLDVVIDRERDHLSHTAFSRLFVISEYDEKNNVLYFIRRSRKNDKNTLLAVARKNGSPFSFKIRRDGEYGELGGTIYPTLYAEGKQGEKETSFVLCMAEDKAEALENILRARKTTAPTRSVDVSPLTRSLLSSVLFRPLRIGETDLKRNDLYKYGISGDFPMVLLSHPSPSILREYLNSFSELMSLGVRCELVITTEDEDEYTSENTRRCKNIVFSHKLDHFLSKRGGIFILKNVDEREFAFLSLFSTNQKEHQVTLEPQASLRPSEPSEPKNVSLKTFGGYFSENGYTVNCREIQHTKWSFILAGSAFGTVVTHDSLGFSYFLNSKNGRLTDFSGDIYSNLFGERLVCIKNGKRIDLIKTAVAMYVTPDLVIYSGRLGESEYKIYVSVSEKYPIKYIRVVSESEMTLEYLAIPSDRESTVSENGSASSLMQKTSFCLGAFGDSEYSSKNGVAVKTKGSDTVLFLIGGKTAEFCISLRSSLTMDQYLRDQTATKTPLPPIKMHFGAKWLDVFANAFLPYQTAASRFRAKSGYFQSSGAFGYRDQLQDVMALCYADPSLARTHLIRCSARQYEDGSVNHWFFPNAEGVKTKCSDDFMYLPFVTAHYFSLTNDRSIFEVVTEYLRSSPLGNKSERFEMPEKSGIKESVYDHCKRALKNSLKRGRHGLPLLGSCDWNDGFSHFGEKGLGESVLNAMQYVYIYEKFIPVMRMMNDSDADFWEAEAKKLRKAAEKCFENDRFIRAYGDNGEKLGAIECDECKIDLTVQAFSVIADIGTKEMQKKALDTMWRELFDEKMMVLRLFSPSFVKNDRHVGYIQGYIDGIRENGGQYTHAAVWGLIALAEFGMMDRALKLLKALCPSWRQSVGGELTNAYKSEPYALCGDVYYSPKFKGRGGWSHYTGSSGWYYRAILETMMGIKLENGFKRITVAPKVEYEASLFGSLKIIAKKGENKILLDGNETTFPIDLDGKAHKLEIFTEKICGIDR